MESGLIFWSLATLAAVFVGLGKGGLPVVAALAVPSLALIMSPIAAAGLLLPVYIVSDVFALAAYRRDFNKQVLKIARHERVDHKHDARRAASTTDDGLIATPINTNRTAVDHSGRDR